MVFYALFVGAELDGLTNLQPRGGCDDPSYPYYFKLRCENCGETSAKATCVSLDEVVDLPTGRGTTNLVQKCKLCGRDGSILMIPGQGTPLTIEQSQKGEKTCLMVFDCRGYEPLDFAFGNGWKAESTQAVEKNVEPKKAVSSHSGKRKSSALAGYSSGTLGISSPSLSDIEQQKTKKVKKITVKKPKIVKPMEQTAETSPRTSALGGVDGTPFDIDCSEEEFAEYDEKGECPVGLGKLQSAFKVVKKQDKYGKTRYV